MKQKIEWVEVDEPKEPSWLRRLVHRFWVWRMNNPKHHVLVVEPSEEEEGMWGREPFDAYIRHPDACYAPDVSWVQPSWWRPMMASRCDMEEWIETAEPSDWPEPPFSMPIHVQGEVIRGYDFVEYDAWLEPLNGWDEA